MSKDEVFHPPRFTVAGTQDRHLRTGQGLMRQLLKHQLQRPEIIPRKKGTSFLNSNVRIVGIIVLLRQRRGTEERRGWSSGQKKERMNKEETLMRMKVV